MGGGNYGGRQIFLDQTGRGRQIFLDRAGVRRIFFDQTGEGHKNFSAALVNEDFLLHINGNN